MMGFLTLSLTIGGASLGLGLWTLPAASGAATMFGFAALARYHLPRWGLLRSVQRGDVKAWAANISPLLNRYSLTWVAGYLMFQLFAPMAIYLRGPVLAGRVGLTVSIFTSIFTLASVWSQFRLPTLSMAVANRTGPLLRRVFVTGMAASIASYLVLCVALAAIYLVAARFPQVTAKLLDLPAIALLALAWGFQVLVQNGAQFLRAFKVEPLVKVTWLSAIHTVGGTFLLLNAGHTSVIFLAFVTSYVWTLPFVVVHCRRRLAEIESWPAPGSAARE
jgi:hypothetical protein